MSMSDCIKCWDTPCTCGHDYKDYSEERMLDFLYDITKYFDRKEMFKKLLEKAKKDVDNEVKL